MYLAEKVNDPFQCFAWHGLRGLLLQPNPAKHKLQGPRQWDIKMGCSIACQTSIFCFKYHFDMMLRMMEVDGHTQKWVLPQQNYQFLCRQKTIGPQDHLGPQNYEQTICYAGFHFTYFSRLGLPHWVLPSELKPATTTSRLLSFSSSKRQDNYFPLVCNSLEIAIYSRLPIQ